RPCRGESPPILPGPKLSDHACGVRMSGSDVPFTRSTARGSIVGDHHVAHARLTMSRLLPIAAFAVFAWLVPRSGVESPPAPLSPNRELASFFPERCRIYLEGDGVQSLLDEGFEHPFVSALLASPLGSELTRDLPRSPRAALASADAWLGRP